MLTINRARFLNDIDALAQIGRTPEGGVTRCAFSEEDLLGRAWYRARILDAGLTASEDGAGNLSAILHTESADAKSLLAGSHLDTVPNGGRFDGALGTLAAFEAVRTIKEAGIELPVHLEAISFTDEEGTMMGLFGSQALTGLLTAKKMAQPRGGVRDFSQGMERLKISQKSALAARRDLATLAGFVEVHIEQGTRLEKAGVDIGVVTSIVGIRSAWLHFYGQPAHAGTMPMEKRSDALWGASAFVQQARQMVVECFTPGVMNCGIIEAQPGSFNTVPDQVNLALEYRHGSTELLQEMTVALFDIAKAVAKEYNLGLEIQQIPEADPTPADADVMRAIESATDSLGLSHTRLMSFAGHDTQSMGRITPSAMFFVPSVDGISHNPKELTLPDDLVNAANVMLQTLLGLAKT